jgi:cytoskeletal protein RodZ
MSLILEALKKSEQQRQQQHSTQQQVRKRTLFLSSTRSGSRSYYLLLAGLVLLVFLSAGWFYSNMQVTVQESPDVTMAPSAPPAFSQSETAESAAKPSGAATAPAQARQELQAPPQAVLAVVEPAPVPREFVDTEDTLPRLAFPALVRTAPRKSREPVTQPRQAEVMAPAAVQPNEQPFTSAPQPQSATADDRMPLYQDLSEELRARMPGLNMSMHFYAKAPERRLVRINDRLMHEGDWLSGELQLVEITPNGATLDFLGKAFEIRSSRR